MDEKMDSETQISFIEGQAYLDFIKSKGWGIAKEQIITPALLDLQSVNNIKHTSIDDMAREVFARQLAAEYVLGIIRDIEGRGLQHEANKELMTPLRII